jgi:hypothetical protein
MALKALTGLKELKELMPARRLGAPLPAVPPAPAIGHGRPG